MAPLRASGGSRQGKPASRHRHPPAAGSGRHAGQRRPILGPRNERRQSLPGAHPTRGTLAHPASVPSGCCPYRGHRPPPGPRRATLARRLAGADSGPGRDPPGSFRAPDDSTTRRWADAADHLPPAGRHAPRAQPVGGAPCRGRHLSRGAASSDADPGWKARGRRYRASGPLPGNDENDDEPRSTGLVVERDPAATYSPRGSPPKYHRRWRA